MTTQYIAQKMMTQRGTREGSVVTALILGLVATEARL